MKLFLEYFQYMPPTVALIVFILTIIYNMWQGKTNDLSDLWVRMLSGTAIPTGIMLSLCAFKQDLIAHIEGVNIYILAAGLTLLYVSCKGVFTGNPSNNSVKNHK